MKAIAIVGPTASGKSALALRLAPRWNAEILACDSMQIYRGMDIGTAKPTAREQAVVPHHLLDLVEPGMSFSAAEYAAAAEPVLQDLSARGRLPLFCGGTGLYLEAVRTGRHHADRQNCAPASDLEYRAYLLAEAEQPGGRELLWERLHALDPDAADATHPNNVRRVVRALEIFHSTGSTKTALDRATAAVPPRLDCLTIGIRFRERRHLVDRIDRRVDEMAEAGLAEEVRRLYEAGSLAPDSTAGQAIGYRQLLPYLKGEISLDAALDAVKIATRQYAKRQMTWFRAIPDIIWLDADGGDQIRPVDSLVDEAENRIQKWIDDTQRKGL